MAEIDPVLETEARAIASIIDELDYFQILKLEQWASPAEIKAAYYRESRTYHPDRFFSAPDNDAKRAIEKIYRRVNESYVCLRDDAKRTKYVSDLNGPDRAKRLRYTEASEQEQKLAREADLGATPQGRKMFQAGLLDLETGRFAQAMQNFRTALLYEKDNAQYRQKFDEAAKLASGRK
jgi:DnaJ-class molecular chaperone